MALRRKPFGGMTDEEGAEEDDLEEDEDKYARVTARQFDKLFICIGELEPSDDKDLAAVSDTTR